MSEFNSIDQGSESLLDSLGPPQRSWLPDPAGSRRELERSWRIRDILWAARWVLIQEGIADFNMERIALRVGLSRAALYQYFSCSDEILVALAIQTATVRVRLYRLAESFPGRTRERMVAIGEVTPILYPELLMPEILAYNDAVRSRATAGARARLAELDLVGFRLAIGVVEDAVEAGDVTLPGAMTPSELVFGLTMMINGIYGSVGSSVPLPELGIRDLHRQVRRMGRLVLDGVGWKPLSREWNYGETLERVRSELYPRGRVLDIARAALSGQERETPPEAAS